MAFPFQTLQFLVCPPGQETGPLPVFFSMPGARDMLPPARKTPQPGTGTPSPAAPGTREGEGRQSRRRHHGLIPGRSQKLPSLAVLSTPVAPQQGDTPPSLHPSLANAEVPEDDVEDILGAHVAGDPVQMPPRQPQLLGRQPQVLPAFPAVTRQRRHAVAQVEAVPALRQAGRACQGVSAPGGRGGGRNQPGAPLRAGTGWPTSPRLLRAPTHSQPCQLPCQQLQEVVEPLARLAGEEGGGGQGVSLGAGVA